MYKNKWRIFDAHIHTDGIFLDPYHDIIEYMNEFGIEKAIMTTINRTNYYKDNNKDKNSKSQKGDDSLKKLQRFRDSLPKTQIDHQDLISMGRKEPERIYKMFWFNPNVPQENMEESYQILKNHFDQGFIGVKIHSAYNFVKVPKDILELIEFMQDYNENLILFLHSTPKVAYFGGFTSKDIVKIAKRYPNLHIIVGHAAYAMEYALEVGSFLKNYKNVYFETSCSLAFGLFNLIKTIGYERILFGSDSPVCGHLHLEIEKILSLPRISDEIKRKILYDNIIALLEKLKF